MSMNLHLDAKIPIIKHMKDGTDEPSELIESFDLWQTPTKVTFHCLKGDPLERYKEWVNSHTEEAEKVGDDEFIWYAKDHLEQLDAWLYVHKEWDIEWYYL